MVGRVLSVCLLQALAGALAGATLSSTAGVQAAAPQSAGPKIWDGVFTAAQAERGKAAFTASCVLCHKEDLSGGQGPALKDEPFMMNWEGESLNRFFTKVRDTMPPNFGLLESKTKIDIVAYIMAVNGFPAGAAELGESSDELDAIQIVRKGAPGGIPNFSLVETVGCLMPGPNNAWMLTNTSEPVVTRVDGPTPAGLIEAGSRRLGGDAFLLVNVARFDPETHKGQKVEAKGLVYRSPGDNRITLTSLQAVSPACTD